jgi:predicted O-linked N-acetylglucosamine transferase (SPINDLY family)
VSAGAREALLQRLHEQPGDVAAWEALIDHHLGAGEPRAAAELAERRLHQWPQRAGLWARYGRALMAGGQAAAAAEALGAAVARAPADLDLRAELIQALIRSLRFEPALAAADEGLQLDPRSAALRLLRARALLLLRRTDEAAAAFREALAAGAPPGQVGAIGLIALRKVCDWRDEAAIVDHTLLRAQQQLAAGRAPDLIPGHLLLFADAPALARQIAEAQAPRCRPPGPGPRPPRAGRRLRIGYLSADLRNHAMGHLTTGVMAAHDRARVEVYALSLSPSDPRDQVEARARAAVDRFERLPPAPPAEMAAAVRALGIDVLIDLMGLTVGGRLDLCAQRPAPLQLTWLGFPGTTGARCFDGALVDRHVAPDPAHFTEPLVHLPGCYQPPNPAWRAGPPTPRAAWGLPDEVPVLGSFSQPQKLDPRTFQSWMALLRDHPDAVLWQIAAFDGSRRRLQMAAAAAGVRPERVIFADYVDHAAHLERLRHVTLGLDTRCWGSHTSARELLWAGAPLVTVAGGQMAARVGASLLREAGLPELVADSADAARALADGLLRDPGAMARARAQVEAARAGPLFDVGAFTRGLEDAVHALWDGRRDSRRDVPEGGGPG